MTILSDEAIRTAANKKARGSIILQNGLVLTQEERARLKKRAQNTPYLDKILRYTKSKTVA